MKTDIDRLVDALKPFAKFGKRLMDGGKAPARGTWYGLDCGCPTEVTLDIEHFQMAIKIIDELSKTYESL